MSKEVLPTDGEELVISRIRTVRLYILVHVIVVAFGIFFFHGLNDVLRQLMPMDPADSENVVKTIQAAERRIGTMNTMALIYMVLAWGVWAYLIRNRKNWPPLLLLVSYPLFLIGWMGIWKLWSSVRLFLG